LRNFDVQTASNIVCRLHVKKNGVKPKLNPHQIQIMKTKHIIATFVALVIATASTVGAMDNTAAVTLLNRAKSHVAKESQVAIEVAIKKIGGNGPNDPIAAAALLKEASEAEAFASKTSNTRERETAIEDAQAFRYAASLLNGGTAVISSTTTSSSATGLVMTGTSTSTVPKIITTGTHAEILGRILAEDETLTESTKAAIAVGIKALKGESVPMPRMWARILNDAADLAHGLIGKKEHWATRLGATNEELVRNGEMYATQDEIALRAAAEAVSKTKTITVVASVSAPVVQRELVVTVPPVVTPPVVTTTATTVVTTKKAAPKPCNTRVSVAPVAAK
jgi:hypothetical protein